jgi:hypothetical protein
VAGHHDSDSGVNWVNIELRKIVDDIGENPAELDQFHFRQRAGPCTPVVVAAYYRDRRNAREFINEHRVADITGVNDEITAAQEVDRLRSEKVMRIRNKANTNRTTQVPSNTWQVELSQGILARLDERCEIGERRPPPRTLRGSMVVPGRLWLKAQFPLVPNRQNAYLILGSHESIQGDIARLTVGNDQLAQFTFYAPANQGMRGQDLDGRLNRRGCVQRGARIVVAQKLKRAVKVI